MNAVVKDHGTSLVKAKPKKYSKNNETTKLKENQSKRPRGRPRKYPASESVSNMDGSDHLKQDLAVQSPENSNKLLQLAAKDETDTSLRSCKSQKPRGRPRKKPMKESINNVDGSNKNMQSHPECPDNSLKTSPLPLTVELPEHLPEMLAVDNVNLLTPDISAKEHRKKPTEDGVDNSYCNNHHSLALSERLNKHFVALSNKTHEQATLKVYTRKRKDYNKEHSAKSMWTSSNLKLKKCRTMNKSQVNGADSPLPSQNCGGSLQQDPVLSEPVKNGCSISVDVALPRLVMGLAHNGKVAWDVKWRPSDSRVIYKHVMGHLAVLLGNGALEV